jgi:pimeloyl-ACP methyl ester carboxylesterase
MIDAVEIETPGGVVLRGQARVAGDCWIVLVHAFGRDLDMWRPLLDELDEPFSVLAVDLRGHGGSDGSPAAEQAEQDVAALLEYTRGCGADTLVAVAAGDVASAVLAAAARSAADAVVLLGPSGDVGDPGAVPRFVVCASEDPDQVIAAEALQRAPGWSLIANVPTAENGADLVEGAWATNVLAYVSSFVRDVYLHHPRGVRR